MRVIRVNDLSDRGEFYGVLGLIYIARRLYNSNSVKDALMSSMGDAAMAAYLRVGRRFPYLSIGGWCSYSADLSGPYKELWHQLV